MNRLHLASSAAALIFTLASSIFATDQPVSTLLEGEQYTLFGDPAGDLTFTTTEVPMPRHEGDLPLGPPVYFWDFGPLHGSDNGDGTATLHTDVAGSYSVTVYCSQEFEGPAGNTYIEQTRASD